MMKVTKREPPLVGRLSCTSSRCVLLRAHLRHPNRKLAFNNKAYQDDYQDEAEQIYIHKLTTFRWIICFMREKSREIASDSEAISKVDWTTFIQP
jgi:hypothetical protein